MKATHRALGRWIFLIAGMTLAVAPALAGPDDDKGSVYDYKINWAVQTAPTEITVEVQARFCPACNPNVSGRPGCTAFGACFTGYGHPACHFGRPEGTYIAVRVKNAGGTQLGMQKRVLQRGLDGFNVGILSKWQFIFSGLSVNAGETVTAEADTYCSWCGHWYPDPCNVDIIPADAKVAYAGDTGAAPGTNAHVSATLIDVNTLEPLVGQKVTFTLNPPAPTATVSAITNAAGVASTTMPIPGGTPLGTYVMDTRFGGNASYFPCSDQHDFTVGLQSQVTYTGDIALVAGVNAHVNALLLDAVTGAPLVGRTITFTLDPALPMATVSAVTNALGIASTTMPIPQATSQGIHTMETRFPGDAFYFGCCDQDDVLVRKCRAPQAILGGSYTGVVGQPITFNAGRSSDPDGPIPWYLWEWYIDPDPGRSNVASEMCRICPTPNLPSVKPDILYEWTTRAVCQHTWHSAFSGEIRMSVMDEQGLNDWVKAYVVVTGPQTMLRMVLKSHADLHLYDPQNRHAGVRYEIGALERQIPDSTFEILDEQGNLVPWTGSTPGEGLRQVISLPVYEGGKYCLKLVGTSDGPFELEVTGTQDGEFVAQKVYSGEILKGEVIPLCLTARFTAGALKVELPALVYPPVMKVAPVETKLAVEAAKSYTCPITIKEVRGVTALQGVTLECAEVKGPAQGIRPADITFDLSGFEVAAGGEQVVHAYISVPKGFMGKTTAVIAVKSANGGEKRVNIVLKTPGKLLPLASAGGPYHGVAGEPVTFDAGRSYDPDGEVAFYGWDWNADDEIDEYAYTPTCRHTWSSAGTRTVRLFIYDEDNMINWDDTTVVVEPAPAP